MTNTYSHEMQQQLKASLELLKTGLTQNPSKLKDF